MRVVWRFLTIGLHADDVAFILLISKRRLRLYIPVTNQLWCRPKFIWEVDYIIVIVSSDRRGTGGRGRERGVKKLNLQEQCDLQTGFRSVSKKWIDYEKRIDKNRMTNSECFSCTRPRDNDCPLGITMNKGRRTIIQAQKPLKVTSDGTTVAFNTE